MALVHHELCFGCGRTNLFGLLLDSERSPHDPHEVAGRCFIKQDHQGPHPGKTHDGIVATALVEAMAFACGEGVELMTLELEVQGTVAVGAFLSVQARVEARENESFQTSGSAATESGYVCSARGSFKACR